jgi:hypothetical protein
MKQRVAAARCLPVRHRDGGGGGSPSAISATSRASFEMGLDLDVGGHGDMVWGAV